MSALFALLPAILMAASAIYGAARGVDVMGAFAAGVKDGLKVLLGIFPSLLALLTAVYMLRASGVLDALTGLLAARPVRVTEKGLLVELKKNEA